VSELPSGSPRVRAIHLCDHNLANRTFWLEAIFPQLESHAFRNDLAGAISQADSGFDVLIVHGDDVPRLASIVREARKLLPSKLIVAVLTHSGPSDRARMLRAGADDVIDLRMRSVEVEARILAMHARIHSRVAASRNPVKEEVAKVPEPIVRAISGATPAELEIFVALYRATGRVVPYVELERAAARDQRTRRSLQVSVCKLRSRLSRSFAIQNIRGTGYKLVASNL